jgi:hypothetical protein
MNKLRHRRQSGQSVIEFIIISLTFFTFFFILAKSALNMAQGHYAHYATFMAARAYFAGNASKAAQLEAANRTLLGYLGEEGKRYGLKPDDEAEGNGQVPGSLVGEGPEFVATDINKSWQQGVTYSFKQRLYVMPLIGTVSSRGRSGQIKLTSESWLGREISSQECSQYLDQKGWLYDNGC